MKWWLRLQAVPGVGPTLYGELLRRFRTPEAVFSASLDALMGVPRMDRETALAIRASRDEAADRSFEAGIAAQVRAAEGAGVTLLTLEDGRYPSLLREIHAPPPVLFVRGSCDALRGACVAVVGSRHSTSYGRQATRMLVAGLVERGFTVVSGMARGIDGAAHSAALEKGGKTVAVLGCGTDVVYPPEHRGLYEAVERAGALVSEFPMGAAPDPHHFPQRNRVISGLSLGVVVVEADLKSGALLTAQHALEQGREVFAVPGPITSERSRGTNRLIQEGAKLVQTAEEVVEEFQAGLRGAPLPATPLAEDLPDEERAILDALSGEAAHIDAVAAAAGLPVGRTLSALLSLELAGFVRQLPGKHFVK
ncbi:MAG: DNA protecting protein DprA [Candidatus Handelsmanbacteria bacterium RIFCSPLOWO2_12_FULL_64_10]|uniref:DNA protecting protein DprA n=1 Tax=Handelsmanbacteria sp. (strain RIFCSPLOWO2_12_FULL_64_10) TaxID=1817868 RepID=A0A1F6CQE9_HANXR|nr:MAG: DNA protecting protein DprA [Candidatus Handelsmanbacteria bacterium RIFCSPLOWO2_12_FULL_64_10]